MALENLSKQSTEGCLAPGLHTELTASGGATRVLTANESGGVHLLDSAGGVAYTLPVPVVGMYFDFYATVSVTSSDVYAINTDSAATFIGGSVTMGIAATDTNETQVGDDASDVTITMNGSTTGGLEGTFIRVFATSTTTWGSTGLVVGSGGLATPYA